MKASNVIAGLAVGALGLSCFALGPTDAAQPAQQAKERTPLEELKRAMEAGGGRTRIAGSMRQEMERERVEAEKAAKGWVNGVPPAPLPRMERAMALVRAGKFDAALPLLKEQMKENAEDVGIKRLVAFALLGSGKMEAGTAMVRAMYLEDPRLSEQVFDLKGVGIEEGAAHEVFAACVAYGNKTQSGSAWLAAAMVAQAEGRLALARTMVDKGVKVGLQKEIGDAFATAIDAAVERAAREKREGRDAASVKAAQQKAGREGVPNDAPKAGDGAKAGQGDVPAEKAPAGRP